LSRVGKLDVVGVLGHGHGQFVVFQAREKQHPRVVEIAAELNLGMPHRPLLKNITQPTADGDAVP
jgi:hypothetical protein